MADIDKSKFNLGYFIKGEGKKDWYKAAGNGWRIIVMLLFLALVGFTIWKAYFVKNQTQTQNQNFGNVTIQPGAVLSGGTLVIGGGQSQKQEGAKKKPWFLPDVDLFVEPYGYTETGSTSTRTGVGARVGSRLTFHIW